MTEPKILIVDDDEDLHTLYKLFLQGDSFRVLEAYNGKEALDLVEREKPDLIILDMIMPVMDGEEFFVRLRTEKKDFRTPVVIASVNENIPKRMFDLGGIFGNLRKPFSVEQLVAKIRQVLAETRK